LRYRETNHLISEGKVMSVTRPIVRAFVMALAGTVITLPHAMAAELAAVEVPGDRAFSESISAASDGTLYVSSLASGGIARVAPGASKAEEWIKPGAFDSRSTFGVFADERSKTLWVCSNDVSALGVPGPSSVAGAHLKGFDLASGEGKVSVDFPGKVNLCNDITVAEDGTLYVTNSLAPQILRLKPGAKEFDVWLENELLAPPKGGAGLDGIAFGGDGNLYVNTFNGGDLTVNPAPSRN
jgi:streptogramin lyase